MKFHHSLQGLDVGLPEDPDLKLFITARLLEDIIGVYIAANFHTVKTRGEMISNSGSPYEKIPSCYLVSTNQTKSFAV